MTRFFNTAGPCRPERHYMLPPERRLPGVRGLIDQELYFVIHSARQVGKTTSMRALVGITALTIPHETAWYVGADGRLQMRKLLEAFVGFWRQHGQVLLGAQPYAEVAH